MQRLLNFSAKNYGPLQQNAAHKFATNYALNIYNTQSLYTFIPKNGCSTMRVSLAIANGCIKNIDDFNWIHKNNQTFKAELSDLITAKYTFVILRSPYRRLASTYLDKIVDNTVEYWQLNDTLNRKKDISNISFREYVQIVTQPNIIRSNYTGDLKLTFLSMLSMMTTLHSRSFQKYLKQLKQKVDSRYLMHAD
ncbi:MAG: sulfotransferase family 2 domain-containing protein [Campylobacterota bacterium]|nr:sulfotransferase family 2 domain-containing protein [Campylobacterota bacterium]